MIGIKSGAYKVAKQKAHPGMKTPFVAIAKELGEDLKIKERQIYSLHRSPLDALTSGRL